MKYLKYPVSILCTFAIISSILYTPAFATEDATSTAPIDRVSNEGSSTPAEELESTPSPEPISTTTPPVEARTLTFTPKGDPITVSIKFPPMGIGNLIQTALKPGDQFYVVVTPNDPAVNSISILYDELGPGGESVGVGADGTYTSRPHGIPKNTTSGTKHFTVFYHTDADGLQPISESIVIDGEKPSGKIEAAFTQVSGSSGNWEATISGNFDGTGSFGAIISEASYELLADGSRVKDETPKGADLAQALSSPFSNVPIPMPAPSLDAVGLLYSITIADEAGNITTLESPVIPIIRSSKALIDHAQGGTLVNASNYLSGGIPEGIGIPHILINSLPAGSYYAVVFFKDLIGCPNDHYQINSFRPEAYWGYDVDGPEGLYTHAKSTSVGGCMQKFHIDPSKTDDWMWGALNPMSTSTAIADTNGVPSFAICDNASVCDAISPTQSSSTTAPGDTSTSTPLDAISSVMFLPGIKGSQLFEKNSHCDDISGVCDVPLWLPQNDLFVPKLFMNTDGTSATSDVYTKENAVLSEVYGQKFYSTFFTQMDNAERNGTFGKGWSWKPITYDWRMSLPDIVHKGVQRGDRIYYEEATDTPYIEQNLETLASSSPTGKVTIIAHSNGGLVAKELVHMLGNAHSAELIDRIILVGVPQSGTPRAIGSLLYGEWEGIPGIAPLPNIIMSAKNAREFGLNSPMAYHLLPSSAYTNAVRDPNHPLILFGDGELLKNERATYGSSISSAEVLYHFLHADEGGRTMPNKGDLNSPNVLNQTLLTYAKETHDTLDSWVPPKGIHVYEISGWGVDTISGIEIYQQPKKILGITVGQELKYRPMFTEDGDGTVPSPSSMMMNANPDVTSLWMDLDQIKKNQNNKNLTYDHSNLFETPELETIIQNILNQSEELPDGISKFQTLTTHPEKKLHFFLHSPLSLTATDADGNTTKVQSSGVSTRTIPGSSAGQLGDVKYITLPAGNPYTLSLVGESSGTFSLDLEETEGDEILATSTFADVPSATTSEAVLTITNGIEDASVLSVDEDGNGTTDFQLTPSVGQITFPSTDLSHETITSSTTIPTVSVVTTVNTTQSVGSSQTIMQIPAVRPDLSPSVLGTSTVHLPRTHTKTLVTSRQNTFSDKVSTPISEKNKITLKSDTRLSQRKSFLERIFKAILTVLRKIYALL